ncbi:hypothetical protein [Reichenbachiella sp.]|uniref:hypothetical protein n=1 Tax=Reichenbachiella sp. TaxID=2184521 RepID=UPI003262FB69
MSFGKRPIDELYNIKMDVECMNNLIDNPELIGTLESTMIEQLRLQQDSRMVGNGEFFLVVTFLITLPMMTSTTVI